MESTTKTENTSLELADLILNRIDERLRLFKAEVLANKRNQDLLTRKEACEFLKIDSSTLWAWTKKGKLTSYGIGNRRYYKQKEIIESLKELKIKR